MEWRVEDGGWWVRMKVGGWGWRMGVEEGGWGEGRSGGRGESEIRGVLYMCVCVVVVGWVMGVRPSIHIE